MLRRMETMPHPRKEPVALPPEKQDVARRISDRLLGKGSGRRRRAPRLVLSNGEEVELPTEAALLVRDLFEALAQGQAVSVVPLHKELTTQEAADLLNISRQGLVDLLEGGALPFTRPGKHRRIRAADLLHYKRQRDGEREKALRELTRLSEEAGDYYGD